MTPFERKSSGEPQTEDQTRAMVAACQAQAALHSAKLPPPDPRWLAAEWARDLNSIARQDINAERVFADKLGLVVVGGVNHLADGGTCSSLTLRSRWCKHQTMWVHGDDSIKYGGFVQVLRKQLQDFALLDHAARSAWLLGVNGAGQ